MFGSSSMGDDSCASAAEGPGGAESFSLTETGRRPTNEDCARVFVAPGGSWSLAVVADGMGGAEGSGLASRCAVSAVARAVGRRAPANDVEARECLVRGFAEASRRVIRLGRRWPRCAHAGTTLCAVLVTGGRAVVASIGDSRAYAFLPDGNFLRLTRDQNDIAEQIESGARTVEDFRAEPGSAVNALTRWIGTGGDAKPEFFPFGTEGAVELRSGAAVLVCTDGLSGSEAFPVVPQDVMRDHLGGREPLEAACRRLVGLALETYGSRDNISVAALRFGRARRAGWRRRAARLRELEMGGRRLALVIFLVILLVALGFTVYLGLLRSGSA